MSAARRHILLAAALMLVAVGPVRAHGPHDVAEVVAISPDFANDRTVFAHFHLTDHSLFARSLDGGRSWEEYGLAMVSDHVVAFAFSPAFAADGTVFAATSQGGVWVTLDRGDTWAQASSGLGNLDVRALAVSPDFALDNTLLAATAAGLYRSADRGASWNAVTAGLAETDLTALVFAPAPAGPGTAFVAGAVLHRSDDGGFTWLPQATLASQAVALAVSPAFSSDQTLAACFGRTGGGVVISTDGGATFTDSSTGLDDPRVNEVAFTPAGELFAVTYEGCDQAPAPFAPWTLNSDGFEAKAAQTSNHYLDVAISPDWVNDATLFVASFEGLFVSSDGGNLFAQRNIYTQLVNKRFAFSPSYAQDRLVFFGNYGDALIEYHDVQAGAGSGAGTGSPPPWGTGTGTRGPIAGPALPTAPAPSSAFPVTTGSRWKARALGISSLYCTMMVVSPTFASDQTIFYGFAGAWRSTDAGHSWTKLTLPPGVTVLRDVGFSPSFASDGRAFLSTSKEGQLRTFDGGDTWEVMAGGLGSLLDVHEVAISPAFPSDGTVYLGSADDGVWRSADGGSSWTQLTTGLTSGQVRSLEVSPDFAADGMLLAGTIGDGLFVSTDRGDSWAPSNAGLPAGVPVIVESIAFSPGFAADHTVFLALLDDGVFRSTDGGLTWQASSAGLPRAAPRRLALSPAYPTDGTLMVTTHDWVWRSTDGGDSWNRLSGFVRVDDVHLTIFRSPEWATVALAGSNGKGVAATDNPGAWRELEFEGNSISWFAASDPSSGIAEVELDGSPVAQVDLYAPQASSPRSVFHAAFPKVGWHTIRVRVTGSSHPSSAGAAVSSDGFAYSF